MNKYISLFTIVFLAACSFGNQGDEEALQVAEQWGDAFFNCDFHRAERYCTTDSKQWLQFAASNTTEQDLQLLQQNEDGATVTAEDFFPEANDTMRMVMLQVKNHLSTPAIGDTAIMVEKSVFRIPVVKQKGEWRVKMEDLPRSGRQSRD